MSVDNSELLMLLGGKKKAEQTIGIAGQQGFGVGVYGGDPADLRAMGLKPMSGCFNPTSNNYGNYIHTNGSVMVFIPAFCYRIGNKSAPSYYRDVLNALEIRDASEGEGGGWILHRSFIDGGVQKSGFFIDKYIASKDNTGKVAVSVKNGDNISLGVQFVSSSDMPGCSGVLYDAITLGRARGEYYSCVTAFQWSAISMLSLAHGQAATSNKFCGWYDEAYTTNYPKGNNNGMLGDVNDSSVKWAAHSQFADIGKTGSGTPFNKTTHNGQNCGVTDVNGSQVQVTIGCQRQATSTMLVLYDYVKAHDITEDNINDTSLNNTTTYPYGGGNAYWGSDAFFTDSTGPDRAMCGVLPKNRSLYGNPLFGSALANVDANGDRPLVVGGGYNDSNYAGLWLRSAYNPWGTSQWQYSFRAAAYPP